MADEPPKQSPKQALKRLGGLSNPRRAAPSADGSAEASGSQTAPVPGGRGGRKPKFTPKVPARRRAAEASDAAEPSTSNAPENEAFKDLIKAAKSEAGWARGQGGGRGRGRGDAGRQHFQTVFGGGGCQHTFAQGGSFQSGGSSGGGQGGGSGRGGGGRGADAKPIVKQGDAEMQEAEGTAVQEPEVMLNYDQYYPTILPLRQPGMEETDAEVHARDDRPPDLSLHKEDAGSAAAELGLLDADIDPERLLLFQLPSLLPVPASSLGPPKPGAPLRSLSQPMASSLDQLPSGKVGKLLVFESGAVKLQMGDVLLDVAAGTPCQFRQEVASINAREGHFVFLGDVAQRVVCSPNVEQLISDEPIPDWPRALQPSEADTKGKTNEVVQIKDEVIDDMDIDKQVQQEDQMMNHLGSPSRNKLLIAGDDQ
ncbi:MAG: DNA binding [Trebouxia sp. A1-2]|nr:MAG: DNA binding [Trebouxia sp. A1-2]